MLLLILCLIILVCITTIIPKFIKENKINMQKKKIILIFIAIVVLVSIFFTGMKIYQQLPHNEVSKADRIALESYILDNYDLKLKVKESTVSHRGDIGINPGIEYFFVLQNSMGFEYQLSINRFAETDLQDILVEKPKLDLIQMKGEKSNE